MWPHIILDRRVSRAFGDKGVPREAVIQILAAIYGVLPSADRSRRDPEHEYLFHFYAKATCEDREYIADFAVDDGRAQGYLFVDAVVIQVVDT